MELKLNVDQMRIVNNKPNGHVLVKGVAGSGKTTVAVSKLSMLINHFMDAEDTILFVTYNKTLIEYTKYLIRDMDIQRNIFFAFDMEKQLSIQTIDSIISYYSKGLKPFRRIAGIQQARNMMLRAIGIVNKQYPDLKLISEQSYSFLNEEVDWLKSCAYIERETYLNADRIGRMSKGENRYRLLKNSAERNAIFDIYLCYERLMEQERLTDFKTNALRVLDAFRDGSIVPSGYRHIIVDESQDLTRVQLEIIKHLYLAQKENSSIMFIADISQSIYTQSWLSGQSFKSIGFDMSGKSNILSKNYRTTYEIAQAAYSLIEKDDTIRQNDIFVKPIAIDRHGDAPCYKHYDTIEKEAEGIAERICQLSSRYGLKDIVIAAANRGYLEHIKDILLKNGVPAEIFKKQDLKFEEDIVRLYTLHSVKGLEFPVLFIAGINEGVLPYSQEQESLGRRLLYVGMTRAKHELYISSADKPSIFIAELDGSALRSDQTEFQSFYKVDISEYLFQDRIIDIYSREEAVRQWLLKELTTKLQYPLDALDIEYPVQHFSKKGYVDIVVFQNDNGKKLPYIMAEVKQPGEDMDRAMKQLKSYVSCCPSVQYIAVADGITLEMEHIQNGHYVPVESLPLYKEQTCNLYEEYNYINWGTKRKFIYSINIEDKEEIIIKDADSGEVVACEEYHSIHVIGKVAAGVLKYANVENLGSFNLPDLFLSRKKDLFLLQVHGDSMINFQIDDGDFVLVQKQSYAHNGDIAVAGRLGENEVTLKQYCNYGGTVGLMSGNPKKYDPIMIPESEVFVNGVLRGVLKRA